MADLHTNLAGELMPRPRKRTLQAAYWLPGYGWVFDPNCPARPADDLAGLRFDLGWLSSSYQAVGYYDSGQGTYETAAVFLVRDKPDSLPRPVFPDHLQPPGNEKPP